MLELDKPFNPQATLDDVIYAYRLFPRRHPDDEGLQHHKQLVNTGVSLENLVRGFLHLTEYLRLSETEERITAVEIDGRFIYARLGDKDAGSQLLRNAAGEFEIHEVSPKGQVKI